MQVLPSSYIHALALSVLIGVLQNRDRDSKRKCSISVWIVVIACTLLWSIVCVRSTTCCSTLGALSLQSARTNVITQGSKEVPLLGIEQWQQLDIEWLCTMLLFFACPLAAYRARWQCWSCVMSKPVVCLCWISGSCLVHNLQSI